MARFFVSFLTTATAVQGLIVFRDATPILNSLHTITNNLHSLGSLLEKFNGGFNGTLAAIQIQGETGKVQTAIDNGVDAASRVQPLNEDESTRVTNVVVELQSDIYRVLDLLVAKKPAFDTAILGFASASFLVKLDLQELRKSTARLGSGIVSKLVDDLQRLGPLITSDIDYHFAEALMIYS